MYISEDYKQEIARYQRYPYEVGFVVVGFNNFAEKSSNWFYVGALFFGLLWLISGLAAGAEPMGARGWVRTEFLIILIIIGLLIAEIFFDLVAFIFLCGVSLIGTFIIKYIGRIFSS